MSPRVSGFLIICGLFLIHLYLGPCQARLVNQDEAERMDRVDCVPDITDMTDYDPVTQTSARCEKLKRDRQRARYQCDSKLVDAQKKLEDCLNGREVCHSPPPANCECNKEDVAVATNCPDPVKVDDMFFRRLTRHLVNVLQEKAPESGPVEAQMEVHLTSHEWKKLQSFVDGKKNYRKADIHDILVGMTIDIFHFNETSALEWLGEQINFRSPGIILLVMSMLVISVVFSVGMYSDLYWNRRFLGCLMSALFVISLIWNWIFLYQEETIKRYRNAQQFEEIPANCMPNKMTWLQSLQEWYRTKMTVQTDPCFEYHRLYQVDPILDIPPSRALAFTVSSMFVEPMKYLGRAVSEFHAEIFRDLPLWVALPALCSCYVGMFVFLYAYIAAPRRVQREPHLLEIRRPRQPAVGDIPRRPMPIKDEEEFVPERDQEDERVENIRPPTLPPIVQEEQQPPKGHNPSRNPPRAKGHTSPVGYAQPQPRSIEQTAGGNGNAGPGAHRHPHEEHPTPGDVAHETVQRPEELFHNQPGPSGSAPQYSPSRSEDAHGGHTRQRVPAVRPKTHSSKSRVQHPVDGNETDISSLSSVDQSRTPRPTDFKGARPSAKYSPTFGDTSTGNLVSHPSSEPSDLDSFTSSVGGPRQREPEASVSSRDTASELSSGNQASASGETTSTEGNTPSSIDSPSDISVISQSPENTNSATYDFISTSCIGMPPEGEARPSPEDLHRDQHDPEDDYDDDEDFVVLKKESQ